MRVIRCDGSVSAVAQLRTALEDVLGGGEAVAPIGPQDAPPERDAEDGHAVVITSGSTGEPRGVPLPADVLRSSAGGTHARLGGPGHWLLALPAQHVAGLQVLTRATLAGTEPEVLDLRDGFDPAAFATAAARLVRRRQHSTATRCYTALVPAQLARLLDAGDASLAGFDAVLVGGAAAPPGLVDRARDAGITVVTTYGMTETAGGCVYDGRPLAGVRVRTDPHGRIELSGAVVAGGYLRTSDLGRLHPDGRLRVLGRADDVVVTGGVNVAPAVVEAELSAQPEVSHACVVGVAHPRWGQQVVAAVVPADPAHPPDPDALIAAVRPRLTGPQTPKAVLLLDSLPLRGIGKPDRSAVARRCARGLRDQAPDWRRLDAGQYRPC